MLEDRDIIERCREGQTDLISILIDRYQTPLYTLCRKLTSNRDDADDLFQDTWVKVMKYIGQCNPERKFSTWLYTICVNRYRDRYRKRKRWLSRVKEYASTETKYEEMDRVGADEPSPVDEVISEETRSAVRGALDRLDDKLRIPMLLFYFREMRLAEVAEVLDIPDGTLKNRLFLGRNKLKAILGGIYDA